MSPVDAALALAKRGLRIHPIRPKLKAPILNDWPNKATVDESTIRSWWAMRPNANVGIACGGEARLLVVDIDPDKLGEASLETLTKQHGSLPENPRPATAWRIGGPSPTAISRSR